jgi:hypothetical protein
VLEADSRLADRAPGSRIGERKAKAANGHLGALGATCLTSLAGGRER